MQKESETSVSLIGESLTVFSKDFKIMNNQTIELYKIISGGFSTKSLKALDSKFDKILCLLKNGANINIKDRSNHSLLCIACNYNRIPLFRYMVENGADIEYPDSSGMTPIMHAAEDFNFDAIKILLEHGADPHKCDNEGTTPLMFLSHPPDDFYIHYYDKYRETFKLLFDKGVDVNAKDNDGDTALHYACIYLGRKFEIIELLLENGSDINSINNNGGSALMFVCCGLYCGQRKEIVQLLLDNGADTNIIDNDGDTALTLLDKLLLKLSDDEPLNGFSDDDLEIQKQLSEIVELLKQYGASR
jgi:ankyrin repeat protein